METTDDAYDIWVGQHMCKLRSIRFSRDNPNSAQRPQFVFKPHMENYTDISPILHLLRILIRHVV